MNDLDQPTRPTATFPAQVPEPVLEGPPRVSLLDYEVILLSETNPRLEADRKKLDELKASIREAGLLQPVLVRPRGKAYELVAGSRRFTAMKELRDEQPGDARFAQLPAIVREMTDADVIVVQLIENIQRADLTATEVADGIAAAMLSGELTEDQVAQKLGWSSRNVRRYVQLSRAPDWLKALSRAVVVPMKKVDEDGQPVVDPETNRQAVENRRLPGLEFSLLVELLALYGKLARLDRDKAKLNPAHSPMADKTVLRVAQRCASGQWSVQRLRSECQASYEKLSGAEGSGAAASSSPQAPAFVATARRLTLDLERAATMTQAERIEVAEKTSEALRRLGFKTVVITP